MPPPRLGGNKFKTEFCTQTRISGLGTRGGSLPFEMERRFASSKPIFVGKVVSLNGGGAQPYLSFVYEAGTWPELLENKEIFGSKGGQTFWAVAGEEKFLP